MKNKIEILSFQKLQKFAKDDNELSLKANALYELGKIEKFRKDFDAAIKYFEDAQQSFLGKKDIIGVTNSLIELAICQYNRSSDRILRAHTLLNDAKYLIENNQLEKIATNKINAKILHYQGIISFAEKHFSDSLKYYKKALNLCNKEDTEYSKIYDSMAIFYLRVNNFQVAGEYLEQSIEIKRKLNIRRELAYSLILYGRYLIKTEKLQEGISTINEALELIKDYNPSPTIIRSYNELSSAYIITNNLKSAQKYYTKAMDVLQEFNYPINEAFTQCIKAHILLKKENHKEAIALLENIIKPIFEKSNNSRGLALGKHLEGYGYYQKNNFEEAIESLHEAIEYYSKTSLNQEKARCYYDLGFAYHKINKKEMVISSLQEALRLARISELPLLTKQIEDFLYEIDINEWSRVINKTALKEAAYAENKSLLETLDIVSTLSSADIVSKDPLLALLKIGRSIAAENDVEELLKIITEETRNAIDADRCTVFMYDKEKNELWSKVALGMGSEEIRFSADTGLAGHVAKTGETINIKDAYNDDRFNKEIDKKTGYNTKTMLCMPMRNINQEIIGVFQVLNKQGGKTFNDDDEDLIVAIGSSAGIALENARLFKKQQLMFEEQKKSFNSFIHTLSVSIDARDKITAGHSTRVKGYASLIAKAMGLGAEEIEVLEYAAALHDIGKLGIKDSVLCKEGRLTPEEYTHIKEHAKITFDILDSMYFAEQFKYVPEIAASHHEKFDGSGYFRGLKAKEIPLGGRILAVSDVFDAITSRRHYRNKMKFSQVLNILKSDSGSHFDGEIVDIFFNITLDKIIEVMLEGYDENLLNVDKTKLKDVSVEQIYHLVLKENLSKKEEEIISTFKKYYDEV
ncbi:MAG: GAF domain-containing protein [Candidatus Gastranaerophilales bacterium]|nr:GAF domain-containing protein [Candidatus Gastranaerophilales bacterium]